MDSLVTQFHQIFRDKIILVLYHHFQDIEEEKVTLKLNFVIRAFTLKPETG